MCWRTAWSERPREVQQGMRNVVLLDNLVKSDEAELSNLGPAVDVANQVAQLLLAGAVPPGRPPEH
ncbi:hypothetical protein CCMA1212_007442 [Trichoderma ghanense]|uniref:Uncharacterized protein n=1 Tax=Trichoderma ghanense TaxID=65468 RepID=A0ABY2GXX5_9HYPO